MKSLTKALILSVMILLVGFTIVSNEETNKVEPVNIESMTEVNNSDSTAINNSIVDYVNKGVMTASWYGPKFHGRMTANGETFNQMAFTAASKTLKFGTLLKITNLRNKKSVVVRINDRGPYVGGRQLDLSKAAALKLGMVKRGVIRINVKEIKLKGINFPVISMN